MQNSRLPAPKCAACAMKSRMDEVRVSAIKAATANSPASASIRAKAVAHVSSDALSGETRRCFFSAALARAE